MPYILVTNDDGVDSPALAPLARAVAELAPIRIVCPARERSWIGKAITRWEDIAVERVERGGLDVHSVHGFPADCANLALHTLFEEPPELVVSGINIGLNTGMGFVLSSGTVGAAMEGWLAGIPSIAFSVGRTGDDRAWKTGASGESGRALWERAAVLCADVVRGVREAGFPPHLGLLNVNFPVEADVMTRRVVTRLAHVGYGPLFRARGDGTFVHDFPGGVAGDAPLDGTDVEAVGKGHVSITPIALGPTPDLPQDLLAALRAHRS